MESSWAKWLLLERRSEGVDLFLEPRFRKETSNFNASSLKTTPFSEKRHPPKSCAATDCQSHKELSLLASVGLGLLSVHLEANGSF